MGLRRVMADACHTAQETLKLTYKSEFTDSPENLHGYKITIGILGVWSVVATLAVIALSILEGTGCKICPPDWLPHGAKCYWFSTESKIWARSLEDCSARSAHMVVIQEQDEMKFLGDSIQEKYLVWTGLSANAPERNWTWVDGSLLNQTLFPVKGSAEENSCGVIKGSQIQSETCSGEYRWICQKDAIPIDSRPSNL
ncbi:unnamed protein product [Caretta caretta]